MYLTTSLKKLMACAAIGGAWILMPTGAGAATKGTLLLDRVGPVTSQLYISNADGSGEHRLLPTDGFDYHASFSKDGQWIIFTSERDGLGQSNLYRVKVNGTDLQRLTDHPGVSDAAVFSPTNPNIIAFVSSRRGEKDYGTVNIWTLNIATGALKNVTGALKFDPSKPHSYFRPSWSPDGKWLALSSDTGSDWRGHNLPVGWERTQESSIYLIKPDGSDWKKIASNPGFDEGSPSWSPDGKHVVFYETPVESTWGAHRPEGINKVSSQLVSVDVSTLERKDLTSTPGFKVFPQYLSDNNIAYHVKGGDTEGLYTTAGTFRSTANSGIRSPHYSSDGSKVVYEKITMRPAHTNGTPLYSFDPEWNYRYIDVFPQLSLDRQKLVYTEKAVNSSIAIMNPDFTGYQRIYDPANSGLDPVMIKQGLAGAFQPTWSPDRQWVAFGVGDWFFTRGMGPGRIMRIKTDGSMNGKPEVLTDGSINAGFPSYSPDGKKIVYRVWSPKVQGLRIIDLDTHADTALTTEPDNLPGWSPDGSKILFTRKEVNPADPNKFHYDVYTIHPDGTGLTRLTTPGANQGHAVWTYDGRIAYSSGVYGFRDELALYDNSFQPDGQNWVMNADGSDQHPITDTLWEEAMPLYIPNP
ncbi:Tol biopolymer transport system component [Paraburkholderia sp. GAS206C]|uniref:Component of the Tol biopolymer transport system n=2 Tax=Burkholderiaceae TaxID=119060 RepID=A0A1N6JW13_9BURK|nr:component of the Tol biopolymer transport system [Paraburkholderia phenazinium]